MTETEPQHPPLPIRKVHRTQDMRTSGKLTDEQLRQLGVIYSGTDDLPLLNNYRDLRSKLLRLSKGANFVCLVCALAPDDETGRLSVNLGTTIAFDQARSAIVIDCDTNANVIDDLTTDQDAIGLTEFIEQDMDDLAMLIGESGIDRLRIVACGEATHTRSEALESKKMKEVILELRERYSDRFIFINSPSMRLSSEVQTLANVSDMVLFQVTTGLITKQQLTEAVELIGAEKVAGIVLRDV